MLYSLHIENIALIKKLSVDFSSGLNVLSGETGAGKSILIDSINFVLGGRADKTLIRYGESFASVEAVFAFDGANPNVAAFFDGNGIDIDDNIIVRRVMTGDNRGECRVNGRLVTLSALKNLTSFLADIYGQNEHQSLLRVSSHIAVIDGLSAEVQRLKEGLKTVYDEYIAVNGELDGFGDLAYREQRLDILEFQINEIEAAAVKEGEEEKIRDERSRLNNMGKLTSYASSAYDALDGDEGGAATLISGAAAAMSSAGEYDKTAADIAERLYDVKSLVGDVVYDVRNFLDGLTYDEKYADKIESRLDEIKLIKKKYGRTVEAVKEFLEKSKREYDSLRDCENALLKLTKRRDGLYAEYSRRAIALSNERKKTAAAFESDIKRELAELSMGGTTFKAAFSKDAKDGEIKGNMRKDGVDEIEFLISPNVGEPLRPLAKIISGGEMSRFMLALKSITAGIDGINVMIFDEIDTGISGKVAEVVAKKLSDIAKNRQVLAVTHLPQLASFADRHFLISKSANDENKTITSVELLDLDGSVKEIARLSGGSDTELAIPHARNIKKKAEEYKKARE
ncbi:MAG: DNA repair protein RecN [Clostridiales bacterium]|jgi:DNA repair protein RecN (Recombination protein N)|nr:DNA repair protein RecN [Clostridiales bacterium]